MANPSSAPSLTALNGPSAGARHVLDLVDNVLVGSDESCQFCIDAPGVSPIHARIWIDAEGAFVFDTHSPSGVFVNDDRVVEKAPLKNGDILWLGTPGGDESIMIQCVIPPREDAISIPVAAAEGEGAPAEFADEAAPPDEEPAAFAAEPPGTPFEAEPPSEAQALIEEPFEAAAMEPPPLPVAPEAVPAFPEPELAPPVAQQSFEAFEPEPASAETFPEAGAEAPTPSEPEPGFEVPEEPVAPEAEPAPAPGAPFEVVEEAPAPTAAGGDGFEVVEEPPAPPAFVAAPEEAFVVEEPAAPPPVAAPEPAVEAAAPPAEEPSAFFVEEPVAPPAPAVEEEFVVDEGATPAVETAPVPAAPAAAPPTEAAPTPASTAAGAAPKPAPEPEAKKAEAPPAPAAPRRAAPAAGTPRPTAAPRAARPAPKSSSPMGLYIGIGAAVLVVGGGLAAWLMRPAPPEPTPPPTVAEVVTTTLPAVEATPEAAPEATPEAPPVTEESAPSSTLAQIEPVATPPPPVATPPPAARPTPTPSPRATPTPRPTSTPAAKPAATPTPQSVSPEAARAAQVAGLLTQAEAAVAAGRMDQAVGHYDEILKLEPQNARATQGKAAAAIAIASLKKNFVTSRTVFLGKPKKGPAGFEDNEAADPDYQGKIEFEFVPKNVKPGDSVAVKAFLLNEGKKAIKVGAITVTVIADGARSNSPGAPQGGEIAPGQRGLLAQLTTAWKPTTKAWAVEVTMISGRSETYSARANWR